MYISSASVSPHIVCLFLPSWSSIKSVWKAKVPGNMKREGKEYVFNLPPPKIPNNHLAFSMFNDAIVVVQKGGQVTYKYMFPEFSNPPPVTDVAAACKPCSAAPVSAL